MPNDALKYTPPENAPKDTAKNLPANARDTVLLVDDDENLLNAMGDFLELAAGVRCRRFVGMSELTARRSEVFDDRVFLALVDINLGVGQSSGIVIYDWLCSQGFRGSVVFLTGHAKDHPLVRQAVEIGNVEVFEKPLEIENLLALVQKKHDEQLKSH